MKARKILTLFISFVLVGCFSIAQSQTFQKDLHGVINDEYVACLNKSLTGSWTYHMTYHVNKKTGVMSNLHWNLKQSNLEDSDGNRYKIIDTGNDDLGSFFWDLFNNINAYNTGLEIYYNVTDGWLPVPDLEDWPEEGRLVSSAFKFIGNGEKVSWTTYWRVKLDKNGEIKAYIYKEDIDCN